MSTNLIGIKNTSPQALAIDELANIGIVYRRFVTKGSCGLPTFTSSSNGITLNRKGIYHITVTAVVSAPAAGIVTLILEENGEEITGAFASETITTATTELRTLVIDYFVLVDNDLILNCPTTTPKTISVRNIGVAATIENIVVNVVKEV